MGEKLLIVTQKMDESDPALGFFCSWARAFAAEWNEILVVCLEEGVHRLPQNVRVFSLGKDKKKQYEYGREYEYEHETAPTIVKSPAFDSPAFNRVGRASGGRWFGARSFDRWSYIARFLRYIVRNRTSYDSVFVHMNPEYVVLGGLFWHLWGKRVMFWYNHQAGGLCIRLASLFVHRVLHTSPYAFTARFKKSIRMPAGIDTERFKKHGAPKENSLLSLGRIAPIKRVGTLIEAARSLAQEGVRFTLSVYGDALPRDAGFKKEIQAGAKELVAQEVVHFYGGIPHSETPEVYSRHEIFINLSPDGLYDKTVLEAMACESLVLASSSAFADILPESCRFRERDARDLALRTRGLLVMDEEKKRALGKRFREYVVNHHSLARLGNRLVELFAALQP